MVRFKLAVALLVCAAFFTSPAWTLDVWDNTSLLSNVDEPIVIRTNGVTLDCANFEVRGRGFGVGIELIDRANVTIKNCRVSGFAVGIRLTRSSGVSVNESQVANNATQGIHLVASSANGFYKNRVVNNGEEGFRLEAGSHDNWMGMNTVVDNIEDGFDLGDSHRNEFDNNEIARNYNGIEIDRGNGNSIDTNYIHDNRHSGVSFDVCTGSEVINNYIYSNQFWGIHLAQSSVNNRVRDNHICHNVPEAILLSNNSRNNDVGNNDQQICPGVIWEF